MPRVGGSKIAPSLAKHLVPRRHVMRVYEVMSKAVETVKAKVAASEAKTRMRRKKIHHLVVTNGPRP